MKSRRVYVRDSGIVHALLGITAFDDQTRALLDRLTHHRNIVETGNDSWRFKHRV